MGTSIGVFGANIFFFFFFGGGGGGEGLQPFETVFQSISNCMPGTGRPLSVSHDF